MTPWQRRRHRAVKVIHHRVGVVLDGLVIKALEVIETQQLGLPRRVELTVGYVEQRSQGRTAFASLLPRRRPRHLTV